jgi:nucleotide-binding universal stress UspA family protein
MDLLVRATRHPDWDPGVVYAAQLAGQLHAGLTALHVVPAGIPPVWDYEAGVMLAEYTAAVEEQVRAAQQSAPAFEAWAGSLGARFPRWLVAEGHAGEAMRYVGNWHDLLVLARDPQDPWGTPSALASIVLQSGLPCLVVPPAAAASAFTCIAVAWNGSVEAIRALHGALPLLQRAERIVLMLGHRKTLLPVVVPDFALEQWCERHGLQVEYEVMDETADRGLPLLDAARGMHANLLVMGAYGRSRFAERVLGGVTRFMLENADLPLLMRH